MTETPVIPTQWLRRCIIAAVVWFFICLLWTAPAALFAALAQRFAPLQLDSVEGGFWHGRAGQAYIVLPNQRVALGSLEWRISPWSLLWLHPGAHITTDYGKQFIDTDLSFSPTGTMRLRDTRAAVPLPALNHWLPLPARGLLALNLSNAKIAGSELRELQGEIVWQQASWQWSTRWLELGDYRGQLQMEQAPKLHGVIEGKGALALNGQIDIDWKEKKYDVQAQLIANESLPKEFRDGLTLLLAAKQDAQGHYQVRRNGGW